MSYKITGFGELYEYKNAISATFFNEVLKINWDVLIIKQDNFIIGEFTNDDSAFKVKMSAKDLDEYTNHEKISRPINAKIVYIYLDFLNKNEFAPGTFLIWIENENVLSKHL